MSRLIANLLNADQRSFAKTIDRLEHMCLRPGVDTRLTAEIITQSREKARRLNLDPKDTTKEELYYGLIAKAKNDDNTLREKFGFTPETNSLQAAKKIAEKTNKLLKKDKVICMKPSTVKKLLKAVPPKRTMKQLKFRSIDSVLKREDPLVLYALACRLEDKSWKSQTHARMKRLQSNDASETTVQVVYLPSAWLDKLKKVEFDSVLQTVPETGSILILPTLPVNMPGSILLTVCLVLQAGQQLVVESLPFRTRALSSGFEKLLPDIALGEINEIEAIHGLSPSWHAVYRLLAERNRSSNVDFEFMIGDLEWQSTETKLASLATELDFWVGNHYLGYETELRQISFHVIDVAASLVLDRKYPHQIVSHLKSSLWNELQLRYLMQENIERAVVSQLTKSEEIML
jgi:hypothetical protein